MLKIVKMCEMYEIATEIVCINTEIVCIKTIKLEALMVR